MQHNCRFSFPNLQRAMLCPISLCSLLLGPRNELRQAIASHPPLSPPPPGRTEPPLGSLAGQRSKQTSLVSRPRVALQHAKLWMNEEWKLEQVGSFILAQRLGSVQQHQSCSNLFLLLVMQGHESLFADQATWTPCILLRSPVALSLHGYPRISLPHFMLLQRMMYTKKHSPPPLSSFG